VNILVLGGYGLIGDAVLARLVLDGHAITGLGRDVTVARRARPAVRWIAADLAALTVPEAWRALLDGVDVVVNAAGALQDGARDDLAAVHERAIAALAEAGRMSGLRRFVQISATGARPDAATAFYATKGRADAALIASDLDVVVLRPGLVIAETAYGGTALLRGLAACPVVTPLVFRNALIRTVGVADVADAVARAVRGEVPRGTYDLVEDEAQRLSVLVAGLRARFGRPPTVVLPLPAAVGWTAATVADGLGRLGWRSPLRSTALAAIADGVDGDPVPWRALTGRSLPPYGATLAALPSTIQERWFGPLWLLKPIVLATLAAFWLVSGLIGLVEREAAAALLTTRGVGDTPAMSLVLLGAVADVVLGIAVLVRKWARPALLGMLAVTIGYLAGGTLLAADLWRDPLGPLVKSIPAAMLAVVALALLDER
jgi:uncharacterized protein YbjT (DUF2867 family)